MNYHELSAWKATDYDELDYLSDFLKKKIYLDKWWVSENFPFDIHRMIDEDNSGAVAYMKQALGTYNTSSGFMQGTLKMLQLMDKQYFTQYDDEPLYDNQPLYNHLETATMHSNIKTIEYLKSEKQKKHNNDKEINYKITMLSKKIKNYQEKYPERII